ncbi:uncharacterized protein LOC126818651 [Patella vulgata]|uniref:uncharacterized protein LOC126818651 n=1 Tax=Patella vulgata TaxID=6465 RepID=UPI00217F6413|nr:uncharacterized protein LOC126818651 [Patella vulgata]
MFGREDLKDAFRVAAVETIIWNMADRVVQVKGPSRTGSGIVFKANGEFYVQTSKHVVIKTCRKHAQGLVPEGTQCHGCEHRARVCNNVEVMYEDRNGSRHTTHKKETKMVGNCNSHEKAIFAIDEVPKFIKDMDIKDSEWLVADIRIKGKGRYIKGLLEYYSPNYIIHSSKTIEPRSECSIIFKNYAVKRCTQITKCSDNCSHVYFDQNLVPPEAKNHFHKDLPWKTSDDQQVVVISFCNEKKITVGEPTIDPEIQDCLIPCEQINAPTGCPPLKDVILLKHDAHVQPGDSGACVLVFGKDAESSIGYKSYMCMHIAGNDQHGISSIGLIN